MRKLFVVFLTSFLIFSCGSGGGSDSSSKSIVGKWKYEYPDGCVVTWTLKENGAFEERQNKKVILGTWEVDGSLASGKKREVGIYANSDNADEDCEGEFYDVSDELHIFAVELKGDSLRLFFDIDDIIPGYIFDRVK